jgi:hypothetical protein
MHTFSDLWVQTKMKSNCTRKLNNDHILNFVRASPMRGLTKLGGHANEHGALDDENHQSIM